MVDIFAFPLTIPFLYLCMYSARNLFSGQVDTRSRGRIITQAQDRFIHLRHLRNRKIPATRTAAATIGTHNRPISSQTVINRLRERGKARRPYVGPVLTPRHRIARLQWCRAHRRWLARQWHEVLFSDESRFCLEKADGRRRTGERYADACVLEANRYRGGSVMVLGGISHDGTTDM